jgi:hypothetical protein
MGDVLIGFFLLQGAGIADEKLRAIFTAAGADTPEKQTTVARQNADETFSSGKVAGAKYFAVNVRSSAKSRCAAIEAAEMAPLEISEEAFAS